MIDKPILDWWAIAPELLLGIASIVVLLVGMGSSRLVRAVVPGLTLASLLGAITLAAIDASNGRPGAWVGQIDSDNLASTGRILAAVAGVVAVLLALRSRPDDGRHGEFHALILAAVCGMGLFVAAGSLVTLFVGLELFSISLYVLCALDSDRATALESGLKYLIIGGLASAVLLYGIALVYGATGELTLTGIGSYDGGGWLLEAGLAMVVAALAFKGSAAPLHWWAPDVYEGAETPVTAFMAAATKAVAFVALARVLVVAFHDLDNLWRPLVATIATASIVVGNLGALVQDRLKRLLAYSSIAHAGYLLTGLVAWRAAGISALVYALVVYVTMTLAAFALVHLVERRTGGPATIADLRGSGWSSAAGSSGPLLAFALMVVMLSLAGIPPTGGFFAKLTLFGGVVGAGYAWLAIVGVLGSVVSLGYYLRVPVAMYLQQSDVDEAEPAIASWDRAVTATVGCLLAAATLVLGLMPQPLFGRACDVRAGLTLGLVDSSRCAAVDADPGA